MAKPQPRTGELIHLMRPRDLSMRRLVQLELPEFLIRPLERRVAEANENAPLGEPNDEQATLNDYVEAGLVNIITLRDVAELEIEIPDSARQCNSGCKNCASERPPLLSSYGDHAFVFRAETSSTSCPAL
jgi:hypothetical protein